LAKPIFLIGELLAKLIFFLGIFFLGKNLYFLLAKIFSLVKAYISSWQNFSLLAKSIFLFG
jgi:hypothetical protein